MPLAVSTPIYTLALTECGIGHGPAVIIITKVTVTHNLLRYSSCRKGMIVKQVTVLLGLSRVPSWHWLTVPLQASEPSPLPWVPGTVVTVTGVGHWAGRPVHYWETISQWDSARLHCVEWGAGLGKTSCHAQAEGSSKQVGIIVGARRGKGMGFPVTRI